jgi:hypothetical protein
MTIISAILARSVDYEFEHKDLITAEVGAFVLPTYKFGFGAHSAPYRVSLRLSASDWRARKCPLQHKARIKNAYLHYPKTPFGLVPKHMDNLDFFRFYDITNILIILVSPMAWTARMLWL